ncbi:MAG: Xaa-Pro peptidase family protein [Elusimicrobiota bacterium]
MINNSRIAKLIDTLDMHNASCALVLDPADILYLTGFRTEAALIVMKNGISIYIGAVNYQEFKEKNGAGIEVIECRSGYPWDDIGARLKGTKTVFDPDSVTYGFFQKMQKSVEILEPVAELVSMQRIVKDQAEIAILREACSKTAGIVTGIDPDRWKGRTEKELAGYLEQASWECGGTGPSFLPVVACGVNSAFPHHVPSDAIIDGGWLKIDYGISYNGYASDLTRTFILDKFIDKLNSEELFSALTYAKEEAVRYLKPGVSCAEVYEAARDRLAESGLEQYFNHGLGHGVGIEVHEKPYLRKGETLRLEPGMVVTVEPGFYMPGIGGMREEDMYLINEGGNEQLTRIYQ